MGSGLTRAWRVLAAVLLIGPSAVLAGDAVRPQPRPETVEVIPAARWDFRSEGAHWTLAALEALKTHGQALSAMTPRDIGAWCPGYARADAATRRAFWVGFLSALAKHESSLRPAAVGGGGRWYGLLQILPSTARLYRCEARTGSALKDGAANLSCAIRIMARTVTRDGVIQARRPRWSGVAADWGPMRSTRKREEMAAWLKAQEYCQMQVSPRPEPRPEPEGLVLGPRLPATRPPERPVEVRDVGAAPQRAFAVPQFHSVF